MSGFWQRALIAAVIILLAALGAKLVDGRISSRGLAPEAATRYRVLRRTLVAAIVFAFTQPLRLGDEVEVDGTKGVVEEIGLTYTWIRTRDNDRLVVPNQTIAST